MKHSETYKEFKEWISLIGTREGDYNFYYNFLDDLHDWERGEVEKLIYEKFEEGRPYVNYFARHMPNLKGYDGIETLKDYLANPPDEYPNILDVVSALYEATMETQYIDMMMDEYRRGYELPCVSVISDSTPSEALFQALTHIYINDNESVNRVTAYHGMLHCKGYIENDITVPENPSEEEMKIRKLLYTNDIEERRRLAEKLANNEQLLEGIPVPEQRY